MCPLLLRYAFQPDALPVKREAARFDNVGRIERHENVVTRAGDRARAGILEAILKLETQRIPGNGRSSLGLGRGAVAIGPGGIETDLHLGSRLLDGQLKDSPAAEKLIVSILAGPTS